MAKPLITVVELTNYRAHVDDLLTWDEQSALINFLSAHPEAGDLIKGTGGIRKIRWAAKGKGKSGGVRVIYFYHSADIPLYLLTIYGKNERADLSAADRKALKTLTTAIVEKSRRRTNARHR